MRLVSLFALVNLQWVVAWAGSLPEELVRALQRREQFYHNRRILFRVDLQHRIFKPNPKQHKSTYLLEILRTSKAVKVRQQPFHGEPVRTAQGNLVRFSLQHGWTSECYLDQKVTVLSEPSVVFSPDAQSVSQADMVANIRRNSTANLYGNPGWGSLCQEVCGMRGVFTIGLDATKLYRASWEQVEVLGDRWVLRGRAKAKSFDPTLPTEDFPDVLLRVELRKPDALVLKLEVLVPFRRKDMWVRHVFRTVHFKRIEKLAVPSEVQYIIDNAERTQESRITIELVHLGGLKEPLQLDLPLGTKVSDERLSTLANYPWSGRLLNEEELQQLAYQQGNLVPPEASGRRYSLWLFVPAMLFFLAAAYLYLRGKRR
ncbi:MAG: hypothetical protein KatS3mg019_1721 [Fimbriimonadales bacterium]|nr:MAG: hypothetical protein KatS3mg019_1721 [Fimbriimonadales bacterium]